MHFSIHFLSLQMCQWLSVASNAIYTKFSSATKPRECCNGTIGNLIRNWSTPVEFVLKEILTLDKLSERKNPTKSPGAVNGTFHSWVEIVDLGPENYIGDT